MPRAKKVAEVKVAEEVAPTKSRARARKVAVEVEDVSVSATAGTQTRRRRVKAERDPNAPKRPLNSFMQFSADYKTKHPKEVAKWREDGMKVTDVGRRLGEIYRALPDAEVNRYKSRANTDLQKWKSDTEKYQARK